MSTDYKLEKRPERTIEEAQAILRHALAELNNSVVTEDDLIVISVGPRNGFSTRTLNLLRKFLEPLDHHGPLRATMPDGSIRE